MPKTARIVRKPPPLPFQDAPNGICRACGAEMLTRKGVRHGTRRWCDAHQFDKQIIGQPVKSRAAVFIRDLGVCCDCGRDCTSYMTQTTRDGSYRVQINRAKAYDWCLRTMEQKENPRNPQSAYVIDLGNWEMDHAMPLHLVDRTDPEAWKQWTLENLRTRCPSCHTEKTTKEAKVRAKIRRIRGENKTKPKRKIQSQGFQSECPECHKYVGKCPACHRTRPKIASQGFQKGHRPMRRA